MLRKLQEKEGNRRKTVIGRSLTRFNVFVRVFVDREFVVL